jgi:hypothetical protein
VVFIESRWFTQRLQKLAGAAADEVLSGIQQVLLQDPVRAPLVRGLGGIRKARSRNPGRRKGKRGGFRYLYLYLEHKEHIHLLLLIDKNEQEDLTAEERTALRKLVETIKRS